MKYKYAGNEYIIGLNDDGKIECRDPYIVGDTVEEVKEAIRGTVVKEKSLPRVNVLILEKRDENGLWFEGTSSLRNASTGRWSRYSDQVWVSYTDHRGKKVKEKVYATSVYHDTPENRELLKRYASLCEQAAELYRQAKDIIANMENVNVIEDD